MFRGAFFVVILGVLGRREVRAEDAVQISGDAGTHDAPDTSASDAAALDTPPVSPDAPIETPPSAMAPVAPVVDHGRDMPVEGKRNVQVDARPVGLPNAPEPAEHPLGWEGFRPWVISPEGISTAGYAQLQYESHQDSQNQLFQGGALQNKDRFDVRRARLLTTGEWQYAALVLEVDANTVNGSQVDLKKAEGSLQYRPNRQRSALIIATLGLFDTPFGYELVEIPRTRWFMEQTTAARALWPGTTDIGARVAGTLGFFRWTVALLNGHPEGEVSPYALQDPIAGKDLVFRFGVDVTPRDDLRIAGDVSSTRGKGFHAGTDATPASVQWVDANRDGMLQPNELLGIPAQAARPSQTFARYALGADLRIFFRSRLGATKLYGEFVVASNMDRGLFVADPALTHVDQRELGYYGALVQEIGGYGAVGFRYDVYNPNLDAFDSRRARLLPYSQAITTYAPLLALTLPQHARLSFEYDFITNALGRDSRGVPTSLAMNTWTLRLQVQTQ
jgi:hypothetical protein